jgi:type VI secretion system secreted protein VgrG
MQTQAGNNWGAHFTPRVGQEVLVGFVGGNIDRPVVIGSLYNGQGSANAQGNTVAQGAAQATGSAPPWFAGDKPAGKHQAHAHPSVLAGFKTQSLDTTQTGQGGYNHLVLDNTPGANRIELATSPGPGKEATRLQLGHLLHQTDNQRLASRGHGLELSTPAWGALRAGSGLLLSAGAHRPQGAQLQSREAQAQLENSISLIHTLAESSQAQLAKIQGEPEVKGAKPDEPAKQLQAEQSLHQLSQSLAATASGSGTSGANSGSDSTTIQGGAGATTAWARPELVLSAASGIATHTPGHHSMASGHSISLSAGQDIHHLAQAQHARAAKDGLILYSPP